MAERTVTVRLRALVDDYKRAMNDAARATGTVEAATGKLTTIGRSTAKLGDSLTRSVTLPLGLVGAAAVKMAGDFDAAFVQMTTLAGASASEIDGLKESVLGLAGETGRAPQELAEALYLLQSSGLDSASAMSALEASAKASAVGLGDTATVADAVSSAMLAYADAGLTAAEATDILVATAKAGKAEPAELASQMGRLLPIASELGITFDQVGAAVASLSQKGNNAEQSTTLLVNVMSKLLKPSQQAITLLEGVGLSLDDIRSLIAEKGLNGALEHLRELLGDEAFVRFLEDTQAIQGALALTGANAEQTAEIFADVKDSVGETENAFSKWADSMGAKNARAFAQLQVSLIRIGEALAPIVADLAEFGAAVLKVFDSLPGPVKTAAIAFGIFAAALGPVMSIGGRLAIVFGSLYKALVNLAVPAGTVSTAIRQTEEGMGGLARGTGAATTGASGLTKALGTAGLAGALLAVASGFALALRAKNEANFAEAAEEFAKLDKVTRDAAASTGLFNDAVEVSTTTFTASASAADTLARSGKLTDQAMRDLDKGFASVLEKAPALAEDFISAAAAIDVPKSKLDEWRGKLEEKIATDANAKSAQEEYNAAVEEAAGATDEAASSLQNYIDKQKAATDPIFAAVDAIGANRDAQQSYREALAANQEAQAAFNEAVAAHGPSSDAAREAQAKLTETTTALKDAQWATVESAAGADAALAGLTDAAANGDVDFATFKDTLATWVAQSFITQEQANTAAATVENLAHQAEVADSKRVDIPVREEGSARTIGTLGRVKDQALNVGRQRPRPTVSVNDRASGVLRNVQNLLFGLRDRTVNVTTVHRTIMGQINAGARPGGRQHGGPVQGGTLYEVAEGGRAELLRMGDRTYLLPGMDGQVVAASAMGAGGDLGGQAKITIDLTGGDSQFMRWLRTRIREETGGNVQAALGARR